MATQGGRVRGARRRDPKAISAQESYLPRYLLPFTFFLPVGSQAIIYKDLRVFPRDLRNLQQLIFPLALGGIWTFQLLSGRAPSGNPRPAEFQQFFSNLGSAGISFFICLSLSGVLGGTGVSREGKGFWLIKVAPLRSWQLLISKWILAYLPFPLVGTLLVVAFSIVQQSTFLDFLRSFALMLLLGAGTSGISLGLGAAFPRLNWENPQQQTSARAGCLIPILYMLYIGMALAFVFGLPAMSVFAPQFALPLAISGWLLLLALTVGLVWGLLALGASRLERVE